MRTKPNYSPLGAVATCLIATAILCLVLALTTTGCSTVQNPPPPVRFATPTAVN